MQEGATVLQVYQPVKAKNRRFAPSGDDIDHLQPKDADSLFMPAFAKVRNHDNKILLKASFSFGYFDKYGERIL